ncbi:hypothetical protein [Flavihumibacter petaseus]|uniref:Uncharacterized protein n=1 Tax=Flavihumibacter petaseus NBRC 106054 TaxID=1220578 RepID=A0A0E9N1D4_9BACT|nr:hypothetical protein [Flavihumibacter petaseus]GAO43852.1 hypothetical protein FPE01S_02_09580 [Flavihumibacter petaseus NBRC 106054]
MMGDLNTFESAYGLLILCFLTLAIMVLRWMIRMNSLVKRQQAMISALQKLASGDPVNQESLREIKEAFDIK